MQGTYFQNASLKSKLLTKNPFLPLGGQEKEKVHYFRARGHLERDGYGVHTVLKVPEAGAVCRDSFSSPRPSG